MNIFQFLFITKHIFLYVSRKNEVPKPVSPSNSTHNFVFSKSVLVTWLTILYESSSIEERRTRISNLFGTFVCKTKQLEDKSSLKFSNLFAHYLPVSGGDS